MIYKAYFSDRQKLTSLPETGMGYQVIDARTIGNYYKERFVVYNSELILKMDSNFSSSKRDLLISGYSKSIMNAITINIETSSISVLSKSEIKNNINMTFGLVNTKGRHIGSLGAIDSIKERADGNEVFVRLSAYEQDNRIDFENKCLKDGSFSTTKKDYLDCLRFEDDPVDRYALPNDERIKWTFFIKPSPNDILQRGIVQPAFGHFGGGIEAYFENGTSVNTMIDKRAYGQ